LRPPDSSDINDDMNDVTKLLDAIDRGDRRAAGELLPLVYRELRSLAKKMMRNERPGQTLEATALVHEAYLRLIGPRDDPAWQSRGHFYAAAAEAMRRILVETARRKIARNNKMRRAEIAIENLSTPLTDERLLALDQALDRLTEVDPVKAELVKLRFFAGLTLDQAALALGVSPGTADRAWAFARAWIRREVVRDEPRSPDPATAAPK
jgi:RNA polymerase sigma factor (TIGR02999 family)